MFEDEFYRGRVEDSRTAVVLPTGHNATRILQLNQQNKSKLLSARKLSYSVEFFEFWEQLRAILRDCGSREEIQSRNQLQDFYLFLAESWENQLTKPLKEALEGSRKLLAACAKFADKVVEAVQTTQVLTGDSALHLYYQVRDTIFAHLGLSSALRVCRSRLFARDEKEEIDQYYLLEDIPRRWTLAKPSITLASMTASCTFVALRWGKQTPELRQACRQMLVCAGTLLTMAARLFVSA